MEDKEKHENYSYHLTRNCYTTTTNERHNYNPIEDKMNKKTTPITSLETAKLQQWKIQLELMADKKHKNYFNHFIRIC